VENLAPRPTGAACFIRHPYHSFSRVEKLPVKSPALIDDNSIINDLSGNITHISK
jgi:hypothetical protein